MIESFKPLVDKSLFLVWGPPSHGPRSKVFARELGIDELHFIYSTKRRGWLAAPLKYPYQAIQTLRLLFQKRPKVIFVQSPPSFAVLFVYIYCVLTGGRYIVDAHSAAMLWSVWTRPQWLYSFLARNAVATIVTNEHFAERITGWGARALVVRDIPTSFPKGGSYEGLNGHFNLVVVSTFAADEPLDEVVEAAADLHDVNFYITGNKNRADAGLLARARPNVHFTDYLPDEAYYGLMSSGDAVMCLTTRNHTMQRGACEALSLGKPIITSDWPLLQEYFNKGTVHVPNTQAGIEAGVKELQQHYETYQAEIRNLKQEKKLEWESKAELLVQLIEE